MLPTACNRGGAKIEKFEVAQNDFSIGMDWDDAKAECAKLGNGWRLPTKNELNVMYKNKEKIGGFAHKHYWSSTEFDNFSAWRQNFYNGIQITFNKDLRDYPFYVRAVRTF